MKYTIRQHYRRLQGRCLRCGAKKEGASDFFCSSPGPQYWVRRHLWKMR